MESQLWKTPGLSSSKVSFLGSLIKKGGTINPARALKEFLGYKVTS